jgi:hypothetical protein
MDAEGGGGRVGGTPTSNDSRDLDIGKVGALACPDLDPIIDVQTWATVLCGQRCHQGWNREKHDLSLVRPWLYANGLCLCLCRDSTVDE